MSNTHSTHGSRSRILEALAVVACVPIGLGDPPQGTWSGSLVTESDDVGIRVRFDSSGVRFTVPHFGWADLRGQLTTSASGEIELELPVYEERAHLVLQRTEGHLRGRFEGWGTEGHVTLSRTEAAQLEVVSEELEFKNGDLALTGTLLSPAGDGPFPAIVWTHGSGLLTREDPIYRSLAAWLARIIHEHRAQCDLGTA